MSFKKYFHIFLKKRTLGISVLALCAFLAGYKLSKKSWNKKVFIYHHQPASLFSARNIASKQKQAIEIPASLILKPEYISQESQIAFVRASHIEHQGPFIYIYLSQFITSTPKGYSSPCEEYQIIDIVFSAHRELIHGHQPSMRLQSPCLIHASDSTLLGPFLIPKEDILQTTVAQQLFNPPLPDPHEGKATLLFSHLGFGWPTEWILTELKLSHSVTNKEDISIYFSSNQPEDYLTLHLR